MASKVASPHMADGSLSRQERAFPFDNMQAQSFRHWGSLKICLFQINILRYTRLQGRFKKFLEKKYKINGVKIQSDFDPLILVKVLWGRRSTTCCRIKQTKQHVAVGCSK